MKWTKLGLVFSPSGMRPWMRSHAALPLALRIAEGRYRVYFASRDERNRSHIGWVELEVADGARVAQLADQAALAPGPAGAFDQDGVYPASVVRSGDRLLLYYAGWTAQSPRPRFTAAVGLAESRDGGLTFSRVSAEPVLAPGGEHDRFLVTSPCVLLEGSRWRMWYVSGFAWREEAAKLQSYYDIKYAESDDGVDWRRDGTVCIGLRQDETNVARPCVLPVDAGYRMWYAFTRGGPYRIGYSESQDGLSWRRLDDHAGIEPDGTAWDSNAQAYPWVFEEAGNLYMLYNGNDFGREGFGLAVSARRA